MWGLLCGHLVAFKAPKSWPNKFLINIWGGFSVIFIASYTANIAALIAGLFFQNSGNKYEAPVSAYYKKFLLGWVQKSHYEIVGQLTNFRFNYNEEHSKKTYTCSWRLSDGISIREQCKTFEQKRREATKNSEFVKGISPRKMGSSWTVCQRLTYLQIKVDEFH
jgi:hypothetical protein